MIPTEIGKYTVQGVLGQGAFATVVKAYDNKNSRFVAIKILNRKMIVESGMLGYIEKELRIISRLNHPNIVKIHEIIYAKENICIVMEYLSNGDMFTIVANNGMHFSFREQLDIAKNMVDALAYLHQRGIAHRDIKPANILFDDDMNPKLVDFGFCCEHAAACQTLCGTVVFLAPEVIKSDAYDGMKSDIWALGVTLNVLVAAKYPFGNISDAKYINLVKKEMLDLSIETDTMIGQVIQQCLILDPKQRITASALQEMIEKQMTIFNVPVTKHSFNPKSLPKLVKLTKGTNSCSDKAIRTPRRLCIRPIVRCACM